MSEQKVFKDTSGGVVKSVLDNGVTVLVDSASYCRTVVLGICFKAGAREEMAENSGITHLVEHLLFKRTTTKSPKDIAAEIDSLGGEINALTDPDSCCLFGLVPCERAGDLMDFFQELLFRNSFVAEDIAIEKDIIRQEILEAEDDPLDVVFQKFTEKFWPSSGLALPVCGTLESLEKFTETDIKSRLREMLCGKRIAIAAAGNIQAHVVHEFAEQAFGHLVEGDAHMPAVPKSSSGLIIAPLSVSQCYLNLGVSWPGVRDGDYIAAVVATAILGGGMSSRLFQVLREERGLTYDVGAQSFCYPDTGALVISAICERRNLDIVLELILEQMATLEHDGVREDELGRVIEMLVSQVEMEADSVGARMWRLVETELDFGRYVSVDETIARLRRLRREKVAEVIRCWFSQTECVLVLGGDVDDYRPSELVAMKTRAVIGK